MPSKRSTKSNQIILKFCAWVLCYILPLRCYSEWCWILSGMLKSVNHIEIFLKMYCLAWNFSRVQKAVHTKVTTTLPRWLKNCRRSFTLSKILIGSCRSTLLICLKSSYSRSVWNLNFMIVFFIWQGEKRKKFLFFLIRFCTIV